MVVCVIVSRCYMFEFLTDRIYRKTGYQHYTVFMVSFQILRTAQFYHLLML